MIRKFKAVGVIFAAILAVSAIGASAASATSGLTPGANPAVITGNQTTAQKLVLGASGTTIKCGTSNLSATTTGTIVTEATLTPTYAGCTLAGLEATVVPNACKYTIKGTATALTATADVVGCAAGAPITITQGTCVITIGNQAGLSKITFANSAGAVPDDVNVTLNVEKIAYTGGAGCPANVQGARTDGLLTGGYTARAYVDAGEPFKEGSQVSLTAH
jgi:hypothetical protein